MIAKSTSPGLLDRTFFARWPLTRCTLRSLLIQMQNVSLRSSGMCRKQNFEIAFTFFFLSSPLFLLFLPHIFFSCWAFSRLHFGGKGFRKAFRILGLYERKGRWVVEQDFLGNVQVNVTWFFAFSWVFLTELCSFWYGLKDPFTLPKLVEKVVLDRWNWWRHKW